MSDHGMKLLDLVLLTGTCRAATPFAQTGCHASYSGRLTQQQQANPTICFAAPSPGLCRGFFPSFFYDPSKKQCSKAIFGGCDDGCYGFPSQADCESSCIRVTALPIASQQPFAQNACTLNATDVSKYKDLPGTCFVQTKIGRCRSALTSYHFDTALDRCVEGRFGGCQDGCQAFVTLDSCEAACHQNLTV